MPKDTAAAASASTVPVPKGPPARTRQALSRKIIYPTVWLALAAAAVYFLAPQAGALAESIGAPRTRIAIGN